MTTVRYELGPQGFMKVTEDSDGGSLLRQPLSWGSPREYLDWLIERCERGDLDHEWAADVRDEGGNVITAREASLITAGYYRRMRARLDAGGSK